MPQCRQAHSGLSGEGTLGQVLLQAKTSYVFANLEREFFRAKYFYNNSSL
jgi:hypothetical protein